MTAGQAMTSAEIWIWPFEEFIKANEFAKDKSRTDLVTLTQLAQSGGKISKQVRLLGVLGQAYIKTAANGTRYVIFKGLPSSRPNLAGTRYLRDNPKVSCFVIGTEEIIEDTMKGTKVAVIAFVAIDIMRECLADKFSMASLGVNVISDVIQATIGAGASVLAGAIVISFGAPVIVTFAVVVAAGFAAGFVLSTIDRDFQLTEAARAHMMKIEADPRSWLSRSETVVADAGRVVGRWATSVGSAYGRVWESPEGMRAYQMTLLAP